jgi:hypothetical protein
MRLLCFFVGGFCCCCCYAVADREAGLEALLATNPPLQPELVMPVMQVSRMLLVALLLCLFCFEILWFLGGFCCE